jgi:hypothetical protein
MGDINYCDAPYCEGACGDVKPYRGENVIIQGQKVCEKCADPIVNHCQYLPCRYGAGIDEEPVYENGYYAHPSCHTDWYLQNEDHYIKLEDAFIGAKYMCDSGECYGVEGNVHLNTEGIICDKCRQ